MHSGICASGLSQVFNLAARTWIDLGGAASDNIIEQVNKCPSGALSIITDHKTE